MNFRKTVKVFIPRKLFKVIEPYGHLLESFLINLANGFPGRGIKVIGVTGTNGKTSTSIMIYKMLLDSSSKVALMSTVEWGIGENIEKQQEHWTNVPVKELMRRLKLMRKANVDWLVLETTSQALAQNRVYGVHYSVAVLTNITHEHLDYHGTFENYKNAKRKLFKLANKNRKGLRTGIINADDPSADYFKSAIKNPILYGIKKGDIVAKNIDLKPKGTKFDAVIDGESYHINCHIPGTFNVYNSLAAVSVGRAVGLTKKQIEEGISALDSVEGRMTRVDEGQDFDVIVDFAHTPDSFEKLFKDIKPIVKGRLIVMFGTPGRRDESKGEIQGSLAGQYADVVVLTEEDDRDVDGLMLMNQIANGVKKHGKVVDKDLFLVHYRPDAIKFTMGLAKKGDTVLLLGKGHEHTIERADGAHPWDEVSLTHKALKNRNKKS